MTRQGRRLGGLNTTIWGCPTSPPHIPFHGILYMVINLGAFLTFLFHPPSNGTFLLSLTSSINGRVAWLPADTYGPLLISLSPPLIFFAVLYTQASQHSGTAD